MVNCYDCNNYSPEYQGCEALGLAIKKGDVETGDCKVFKKKGK